MATKDPPKIKFEAALEDLEQVVEQLESGDLSLEDSLAAFEKGVGLVRYCNQKLSEVERKVELLVKDKEGQLQLKAFGNGPSADQERDD
ncbi:MAG: exodeoxyribonuclease VII small subunit [Deltaproteobacteria bacterium]|nr:exodeoxyribonuclease VII small subunit [Deltaproteobacteria bacterium]